MIMENYINNVRPTLICLDIMTLIIKFNQNMADIILQVKENRILSDHVILSAEAAPKHEGDVGDVRIFEIASAIGNHQSMRKLGAGFGVSSCTSSNVRGQQRGWREIFLQGNSADANRLEEKDLC